MTVQIRITDASGREATFQAEQGQSLLRAGLAAGCGLPYECASGTCGSCKASLVDGDVVELWSEAPAKRLCRTGDVLLCQTAAANGSRAPSFKIRGKFTVPQAIPCREFKGVFRRAAFLTEDTATFEIRLDRPMPYQAGQFVLVNFPELNGARAYSMTNAPGDDCRLRLLIRKLPQGGASSRLFSDHEFPEKVSVFGPLGKAVFSPEEERPFVAIAGGSGIAGLLSIIESSGKAGLLAKRPCRLFFGLRNQASMYLLDKLSRFVEVSRRVFSVTVAFSEGVSAEAASDVYPLLTFCDGLVHDVARTSLADQGSAPDAIYFVAGPPLMVEATMRMLILDMKIRPGEIRYDRFG